MAAVGTLETVFDPVERPPVADMTEALGYRERYEAIAGAALESVVPNTPTDAELAAMTERDLDVMCSEAGHALIVQWETGGRQYYEKHYKSGAVWPGYSSGITIGFGYDLGYNTLEHFRTTWGRYLSPTDMTRLAEFIGFSTTGEDRAEKVARAKRYVRQVEDIRIPWGIAETVYHETTAPQFMRKLLKALPNLRNLDGSCIGALLSLAFNRGENFQGGGSKRRHMRQIYALMLDEDFEAIPQRFLDMREVWGMGSSLSKRREQEAELFDKGLEAWRARTSRQNGVAAAGEGGGGTGTGLESVSSGASLEGLLAVDDEVARWSRVEAELERIIAERPQTGRTRLERAGRDVDDVAWAGDNESPDYRHLNLRLAGAEFTFRSTDLLLLLEANRYQPKLAKGKLLFGLRGCKLASGLSAIGQDELALKDARPDHRDFRCLMGVLDITSGKLSAFAASTVPTWTAVFKQFSIGPNETYANLLGTGCYGYIVGPHIASSETPGAMLLRTSIGEKSKVLVLRGYDDVVYSSTASKRCWHVARPGDNIHPAFGTTKFSSNGCQVVRGTYRDGHQNEWELFRRAVGLSEDDESSDYYHPYDYVLLTGLDAALAADVRTRGLTGAERDEVVLEDLTRLRFGSQGESVRTLQSKLGLEPTGLLDADTRKRITDIQLEKQRWADGIYSPDLDQLLGFGVFSQPELQIVT
jgi:hypothetical protein